MKEELRCGRRCNDCQFFEFNFMGSGYMCMNKEGEKYREIVKRDDCCGDWVEL